MSLNSDYLQRETAEIKIALDSLSALSGIPSSTLSLAVRGIKDLSIERFQRAAALLSELRQLIEFHGGAPISWSNVDTIRELLDKMRTAKRARAAAAITGPDPLTLLGELSASDVDTVATRYGWSRSDLLARLTAARDQMHALTMAIFADNSARGQV